MLEPAVDLLLLEADLAVEQDPQAGMALPGPAASVDFIAFEHTPTKAVSRRPRRRHAGRRRCNESGCVAADY